MQTQRAIATCACACSAERVQAGHAMPCCASLWRLVLHIHMMFMSRQWQHCRINRKCQHAGSARISRRWEHSSILAESAGNISILVESAAETS